VTPAGVRLAVGTTGLATGVATGSTLVVATLAGVSGGTNPACVINTTNVDFFFLGLSVKGRLSDGTYSSFGLNMDSPQPVQAALAALTRDGIYLPEPYVREPGAERQLSRARSRRAGRGLGYTVRFSDPQ
jgi:hypothetical protein